MNNFPRKSIDAISDVLDIGAAQGYTSGSWRSQPIEEHLGACLGHIGKYIRGSREENHLEHALCRLAFVVDMLRSDQSA